MLVIPPSINRTANSPPPPNSAFLSLSTSSLLLVVLPVGRWCCSSSYYSSSSSSSIFAQPLPHAHAHTHPPTSGSRSPPSRSPCRLPAVAATLHLEFPRLLFFLGSPLCSIIRFDFFPLLLPSHSGFLSASASIWLLLPWLPLLTDNHPPRFVYPP